MGSLADDFNDASQPPSAEYRPSKLDRQLAVWKETEPDLYTAVMAQLETPEIYAATRIAAGLGRVGFPCSESLIRRWRGRNLNVTR